MVNRVSNDQLDVLLNFLVEHPSLAKGVSSSPRCKETIEKQWNDLASKLNSFGSGSSKTGYRWKKYWFDLKHKSKTRLAKWRMDAQGAGSGLEDISDIDKKILAIIGVKAVYGDSQHRVTVVNQPRGRPETKVENEELKAIVEADPSQSTSEIAAGFGNIQPEVQVNKATVQPDNFIEVSEEVVISDTSELPEPDADLIEVEIQQAPEPHQTGLESPLSQPQSARSHRRLRHNRTSLNSNSNNTTLKQWVQELERNRVQAEKKMAAATLMIAEAVNKIADASLMNAETNRMNAETNRINAETNRMNAETNRKELEIMKAIMDVMGQPGQLSSARLRAEDSLQSENEITKFCPTCNTAVLQTLNEKDGRNSNKRQEPPKKRRRARKRSRQTDSASEADRSDDNHDDNEHSSNRHDEEPEIEVGSAAVKVEPIGIEVNKEHALADPISLEVKTEPRGDEVDNQHTQSESSTTKTASSVRLTEGNERSMLGETDIKAKHIESHEEGFS